MVREKSFMHVQGHLIIKIWIYYKYFLGTGKYFINIFIQCNILQIPK